MIFFRALIFTEMGHKHFTTSTRQRAEQLFKHNSTSANPRDRDGLRYI